MGASLLAVAKYIYSSPSQPFLGSSHNAPPHKQRERNVVRKKAAVCGEERCVTSLERLRRALIG